MDKEKKESTSGFMAEDFSLFEDIADVLDTNESDDQLEAEIKEREDVINNVEDNVEEPSVNDETQDEETEDQVEESDEVDETIEDNEETDDEESSLFTPYAKMLVDEGIFSTLELNEFDGTADGLKKAMVSEVQYYVDQYKNTMPSEVKRLLDGYEQGVPFDEMVKISSDRIRYDNISEDKISEDTDLQKNVLLDYLNQTTQLNDTMKNKLVSQFEDNMELEEQSKTALSELKTLQEKKESEAILEQQRQQKAMEQQQEEMLTNLNRHINDTAEVVPGLKINQMMKDKIRNNLTVPVEYDQFGNPVNALGKYMRENPIEGEFVLNYLYEATGGFKNWEVFGKAGKSQAIKELEQAARAADGKHKGTRAQKKGGGSNSDLARGISDFLKG